jgi:hypothetical protein
MTRFQLMKRELAKYAPNVKTLKRTDYRYASCNGKVVHTIVVEDDKGFIQRFTIQFVANRRTVVDYLECKAWVF